MESAYSIHLKISKVENGQYLAESDDIPGLVAQGRTIPETVEIAQDVAKKLIESYVEHDDPLPASLKPLSERAEIDITVGLNGKTFRFRLQKKCKKTEKVRF